MNERHLDERRRIRETMNRILTGQHRGRGTRERPVAVRTIMAPARVGVTSRKVTQHDDSHVA